MTPLPANLSQVQLVEQQAFRDRFTYTSRLEGLGYFRPIRMRPKGTTRSQSLIETPDMLETTVISSSGWMGFGTCI